jgi:hypothetical protein
VRESERRKEKREGKVEADEARKVKEDERWMSSGGRRREKRDHEREGRRRGRSGKTGRKVKKGTREGKSVRTLLAPSCTHSLPPSKFVAHTITSFYHDVAFFFLPYVIPHAKLLTD